MNAMTSALASPYPDVSFERAVSLDDGRRVRLRSIRPADAGLLRDGFERLSMRSRLMRFFAPLHTLSDETVRYLTDVDGIDHTAIIAVSEPDAGGAPPQEQGFGVARFIRSADDPSSAEAALTVTDDAQGRGLGRQLLEALAVAARQRGVKTFMMSVLWSNSRLHDFLRRAGATRRRIDGEVVEYTIDTALLAPRSAAGPVAHARAH
jgi:GNAT superfamily N-acetyltransferase